MAENINNAAETVVTTPPTPTPTQAKPEDIAAAFMAALDARTQRAERGVAKSFAEQYGMSDAEINAILTKAKQDKAREIPADVQAQISAKEKALNDKIIAAEVRAKGAALGLVDSEIALQIMDKKKIDIADDGTIKGVDEALESLKNTKPFLFTAHPTGQQATVGVQIDAGSGDHTYTLAEVSKMSRDEIKRNLDKIFKQKELK